VNVWQENVNITLGKPTEESGRYAFAALEEAVKELKMGFIDALVTAPIHKKAMEMASFPYPGHTEYITQALDVKNSLMLMISDEIKLGVVTGHVPVKEIANRITKEAVLAKINMLNDTLRIDFGYDRPRIAVLGLNPHAGDGGVIGKEEGEQIFPAIQEAKEKDILAFGPFSPDAFFATSAYKKFDGVLAMYHDQGLIPFKMIAFGEGVNYTAGLPFVRTSPDHGTAMDIAGMDKADETSFKKAIFWATDITRQRVNYMEMHLNPVQHIKLESEDAVAGREKSLLDG
jgi:4-hydroxythreonine-4-phosphate dehydrogenase